ncbi:MAG: heme NO-binding domain-containing protein [Planctomycetota bacterium]
MKGIIFKILEDFVVRTSGEVAWEELLDATELATSEPFIGPGDYPVDDLLALANTYCVHTGDEINELLTRFGRHAFPLLLRTVPNISHNIRTPKDLLERLDSLIHTEVRKLHPAADTPQISFLDTGPDSGTIRYVSERRLCPIARGLIDGLAHSYGKQVEQDETECMRNGADACEIHLRFASA